MQHFIKISKIEKNIGIQRRKELPKQKRNIHLSSSGEYNKTKNNYLLNVSTQ